MHLELKDSRASGLIAHAPAEGGATRIEGYASVFGVVDGGGDVVEAGSFRASLARLSASGRRVRMLWQHDPGQPIGVWDEVVEDGHGLKVRGRILDAVERGREAASLIRSGAIDGLSIGYRTLRATRDGDGRRHLAELDLWEVSLVTFPMLPAARVAAKAAGIGPLDDLRAAVAEARRRLSPAITR